MQKQRIVVKIGSSSLTSSNGLLNERKVKEHVEAIAYLKKLGHEVILITSGAVAAGFRSLGYTTRPKKIAGKQAAASVGQSILMKCYATEFSKFDMTTSQILLTKDDFYNKNRFQNLFATMTELIHCDVVPIVNENDTVSIDELTFGDNDMLSALVSGFLHASMLIILTDINGLYDANPHESKTALKYHYLPEITDELLGVAGDSTSGVGTGGMRSKLLAAQKANSFGVMTFVGVGSETNKLATIIEGKGDGTYIGVPSQSQMKMKKQWIGHYSNASGQIVIDKGAEKALLDQGKSLLPIGVTKIIGTFSALSVIEVLNENEETIGRGITFLNSDDLLKVKGLQSDYAKEHGINNRPEVIHRDNWISLKD